MSQPAIQVEGLTKYYGAVIGIEELSFEVAPGEVYGFLGANGAGKTTTIRLLLDLLRPSRGRARACSASIAGATAWRRGGGSATFPASCLCIRISRLPDISTTWPGSTAVPCRGPISTNC